jgi:hypothetical protein
MNGDEAKEVSFYIQYDFWVIIGSYRLAENTNSYES